MTHRTTPRGHPRQSRRDDLFRSLFDNTLEAIVITDADGGIAEANGEACFLFGRTADEMRAAPPSSLVDVDDPRTALAIRTTRESGRFSGLLTLLRKDGRRFEADVSATRFTDQAGRERVCAFVRDVATRELAEQALLASEHRYRSLIETTGSVLIGVATNGTIFEWNREAERVYGCSRTEALGRDYYEHFVPPETRDAVRADVATVMRGAATRTFENVVRARHGRKYALLWNVTRLFGISGEPIGVIASGQDITELKRLEEERRALEAKVQHAQKLESLGILAGGIAHDFNNLLVGILGNASLALMDIPEGTPLHDTVADIETTALRAAELTTQMLAYSGKGRFVVRPVDLNVVAREMAQLLHTVISKRATLKLEFAPTLPPVVADSTQLRQIVMNLITNASDALGDESGRITLRTGVRDADRSYLRSAYIDDELPEGSYTYLEVTDTGCGMDADTQSRIFEPFFSTKFTGRGLGLAATLGIVRGHRGTVKVESDVGRGTTITVLFPAGAQAAERIEPGHAAQRSRWRGSGTVLVVDDDETVRSVARHMLERAGFNVLLASDGRDGLEVFSRAKEEIALVVLDVTMPHVSGEEAFRMMREQKSDVRVILMSGFSGHELANRYGDVGLAGFIQKPFRADELDTCLRAALGAGRDAP